MKITFQTAALESALASMQACTAVRPADAEEPAPGEASSHGAGALDASIESAEEEAHA